MLDKYKVKDTNKNGEHTYTVYKRFYVFDKISVGTTSNITDVKTIIKNHKAEDYLKKHTKVRWVKNKELVIEEL